MASIISQINWIGNGERADSVTLNRPLLEFLSKYETGNVTLEASVMSITVDPSTIIGCNTGDLVSIRKSDGKIVQASSTETNVLGIIDVLYNKVYMQGLIPSSLVTVNPNERYYQDLSTPGAITNIKTASAVQVGKTIDKDGDGVGHLLFKVTKNGSEEFVATAGQTDFTVTDFSTDSNIFVFQNGILLSSSDIDVSTPPLVKLLNPAVAGDIILIKIIDLGI